MSGRRARIVVRTPRTVAALLLLAAAGRAAAQQGDRPGEAQPAHPAEALAPPAPYLDPETAARTLVVEPGLRVDLVAAEPLVVDPVQIVFDARGRLWAVEMRGYMPDVDGRGEREPIGAIAVLEDRDGDGMFETRTTFLDGLVLPRAVLPRRDDVLVLAPPDLLRVRDLDGDGRADAKEVLATGFGGIENPEHAGNGLLPAIDNRILLSQHPQAILPQSDGTVVLRASAGHGQWGIAQDDAGRVFTNTNSDPLRVDLLPSWYGARNPRAPLRGVNERVAHDMRTWPVRPTPGVNRGYQKATLRDDGTLASFTAGCAPFIVRETLLGPDRFGNALVCEPAGNLVKRYRIVEDASGTLRAENVRDGAEMLASTDERFRPVAICAGPDGAIYVADMYRGVIQHRTYVTSFLRRQIEARDLAVPLGGGRIWRLAPADAEAELAVRRARPRPATLDDAALVPLLASPEGWWRDAAQRELVERRATAAAPSVRDLLRAAPDPRARLHALWTLAGLEALAVDDALAAAADDDPFVRAAALRLLEPHLDERAAARAAVTRLLDDPHPLVRTQACLSAGESRGAWGLRTLLAAGTRRGDEPPVRSAVLSGLHGREDRFLAWITANAAAGAGVGAIASETADAILRGADPDQLVRLVEIALASSPTRRTALFDRVARAQRLDGEHPRTLRLARAPRGWHEARADEAAPDAALLARMDERLDWPDRGRTEALAQRLARDPELAARHRQGARLFAGWCAACHGADGAGGLGAAPPLLGTPRVLGDEGALVRILLHGLAGPLEVDGVVYDGAMPPAVPGDDASIAAVLTFVRLSWGNDAAPVDAATVARIRVAVGRRETAFTVEELR